MATKKIEIFICFAFSGANDIATTLDDELSKVQEYNPFYASRRIRLGAKWREKRNKAIKDCDIFLFIATYDAFRSTEVFYELGMAMGLGKTIIPCRHKCVKWSSIEEIGIDTQGISFGSSEECIREILPRLEEEFGIVVSTTPSQVNNNNDTAAAQRHEVRLPTKSNPWRISQIKMHLEDATNLDYFSNPAFVVAWLFRVQSSLKEMFGGTSPYYRLLPRIKPHEIFDATLPWDLPFARLEKTKKHLQNILKDLEKKDNSNS